MHLKESYQRTLLIITAFAEDDVIVTSGNPLGPPINGDNNGLPIGTGIGDTPPIVTPGPW